MYGPPGSGKSTCVEHVLVAFAHADRLEILGTLNEYGRMEIDHLVSCVVSNGESKTLEDGSGESTMRHHHVHLPKLTDTELVEYDQENGLAKLTKSGYRSPTDAPKGSTARSRVSRQALLRR